MTTKDTIVSEDGFGFASSSVGPHSAENPFKIVRRFTLTNKNGASVRLITWGAGVQSIIVPNNQGVLGDVALGFDNIDGYLQNRYIGRITNRVAIGMRENSSSVNNDKVLCVNGRLNDFDNVNWESCVLGKQVIMSHLTRDAEYSANMLIQAKYSWTDENELNVNICASATGPIPVNVTNYCPLNLAGHGMTAEELNNHVVTINADKWISTNKCSTVSCRNVNSGMFDLRNPTKLKNRLQMIPGGGYDHNFRINSPSKWCYRFHGRVLHPASGRFLEIYSDQPGLRFYTGNDLPDPEYEYLPDLEDRMWGGCDEFPVRLFETDEKETNRTVKEMRGKDGISYRRHGAFVLSPQSIPARVLRPGKVFEHNITYKFGVKSKNH